MKIASMRRFAKNPRLQADSVPEITQPFEDAALELSRTLAYAGGKLRGGHLLNALIHAFNQKSAEERLEIASDAIARLEILLSENDEEREGAEKRLAEKRGVETIIPNLIIKQRSKTGKSKPDSETA